MDQLDLAAVMGSAWEKSRVKCEKYRVEGLGGSRLSKYDVEDVQNPLLRSLIWKQARPKVRVRVVGLKMFGPFDPNI